MTTLGVVTRNAVGRDAGEPGEAATVTEQGAGPGGQASAGAGEPEGPDHLLEDRLALLDPNHVARLVPGRLAQQLDEEFDRTLGAAIDQIHAASVA